MKAQLNRLSLDHFFVGVSEEEFADLRKLTKVFPKFYYKEVKSGNDGWTGLYWRANNGTYFEVLPHARRLSVGFHRFDHPNFTTFDHSSLRGADRRDAC